MLIHLVPPIRIAIVENEAIPAFKETATVRRPYLSYREYLQHFEPTVFALLLDPETENFADDYRLALRVATERGERGVQLPGEKLPLYRDCVWSEVYRRQR